VRAPLVIVDKGKAQDKDSAILFSNVSKFFAVKILINKFLANVVAKMPQSRIMISTHLTGET